MSESGECCGEASADIETFDRLGTGKRRGEKLVRIQNTGFMGTRAMRVEADILPF